MNREAMTATIQKLDQSTTPASSIPKVIVRAEPTLARILKTLDADYVKVQVRCCNLLSANFIMKNTFALSVHLCISFVCDSSPSNF